MGEWTLMPGGGKIGHDTDLELVLAVKKSGKSVTMTKLSTLSELVEQAQLIIKYMHLLPVSSQPFAEKMSSTCLATGGNGLSPKQRMWVRLLANRVLTCDDVPRFKKLEDGTTLMLCFGCGGECNDEKTKGVCTACQRKFGTTADKTG